MRKDIYQEVTNQIIEQIESGTMPWLKPWKSDNKATASMPHNAFSGRAYSGVNVLLLWGQSFTTNGWLTFKQAKSMGGNVVKGSKGTRIVYFQPVTDSKSAEKKGFAFLKTYTVFNLDQCEGLDSSRVYQVVTDIVASETEVLKLAMLNDATVNHGGDRAFFSPSHDSIQMPDQESVEGVNGYDGTLAHELTHWSGHSKRLDRQFGKRFGDDAYAFEELVAEMGSAFLCVQLGVEIQGLQHANYLNNWLNVLKRDNKAIFTAAKHARLSSEFLLECLQEKEAIAA